MKKQKKTLIEIEFAEQAYFLEFQEENAEKLQPESHKTLGQILS
jgi:hypothetical protein